MSSEPVRWEGVESFEVTKPCIICLGLDPLPDGAPPRPEHQPDEHTIDFDPNNEGERYLHFGDDYECLEWIERAGARVWQRRFRRVVE